MKKTTTTQAKANTTKAQTAKSTKPTTTAQAKANNNAKPQTNKNVTKSFKSKTVQVEVTNIQLYDDVSVTIETDTLSSMQSWAYHTYRDLSEDSLYVDMAVADGKTDNLISRTEAELNQMMADAALMLSMADPDDDERYCVTGCNVFESCTGIISICRSFVNALHGNYNGVRLEPAKPSRKPGRISVVKTMSEGLKYTDIDEYDDF
jgi:hypothetical protein